jgi:hypothetical protein
MWLGNSRWRNRALASLLGAGALGLAACGGGGGSDSSTGAQRGADTGSAAGAQGGSSLTFSHPSRITNPYLPISKFHRCVLAGKDQDQRLRIVRTLSSRTEPFRYRGQTVDAAVVHDRVTDLGAGQVIERTIDYFAQDDAGTVFYFGEDVNEYEHGKLVSHEGQWRLGRDTQEPGVLMPANPRVGDTFKSEDVPGITHETDHVVSERPTARVGGDVYRNVIKVRENAGPPPEVEYKTYSPGTGVITEANGGVRLLGCS